MRLSEAILIGDSLRRRYHLAYLEIDGDGQHCGCALGGAFLAAGHTLSSSDLISRPTIMGAWPWLAIEYPPNQPGWGYRANFEVYISNMFWDVCSGEMTIEQLADQVREWEDQYDPSLKEQTCNQLPVESSTESLEKLCLLSSSR